MKKRAARPAAATALRQRAEQKLREKQLSSARQKMSEAESRALLHELQVHQIELEMQNEELLQAQASAREAADRFTDLFDFAPVAYFVLDARGVVRQLNLAGAALLGLDRQRVAGQTFARFVAADSQPELARFRRSLLQTEARLACELRLLKRGGLCAALVEGVVVENGGGDGKGCRLAVTDVTARKLAESEARNYRDHLEELVRARTTELDAANVALQDARRAALNLMEDALRSRQLAVDLNAELRGEIEQRKLAEEKIRQLNADLESRVHERTAELRASALYARSLFEASLDPLVTIGGDGRIADVNNAGELITGLSREQLIGKNFQIFTTEPAKAEEGFRRVMREGQLRDYPLTIRHASGRNTDVVFNASVYRNVAGEAQGVFAAARDITERQRMEAAHLELLRRLADAEETERSRISRELHDRLGQDLTGLKLGLLFIRKQGPFTPPVQESVERLEQLADGLMRDIHRLAWELHPAALDDLGLEAVLRQITEEWSEHNRVPVDFLSEGVETKRLPLQVETTLYRVAQEALNNVTRHAGAKRVSVLLERRPDHVSLIVEDDGRGFAAVNRTPTARGKLGLLGMRERVTLVGGTFEIESTPNAGTTVFIRVPLRPEPVKGSKP